MDGLDHGGPGAAAADRRFTGNTHVHLPPNFSAFRTAEEAAGAAASQGVAVLGTSNYHDFRVYEPFAEAARARGVMPLFGVEIIALLDEAVPGNGLINDPSNVGRTYMCGKGLARFDSPPAEAQRLLAAMRARSDERIRRMTSLVRERFAAAGLGPGPDAEAIAIAVADRATVPVDWVALQERHVARAFQEVLFGEVAAEERSAALARLTGSPVQGDATDDVTVQEALRSGLLKAGRAAFVPEAEVTFDDAYRLVLELGGIPCYPILADGTSPVCSFEDPPDALAARLLARGIHCAELIPARNDSRVVDQYVTTLRGAGIIVLAGTEHNTQRMIPMTPATRNAEPLSEMSRAAFREGACVIAAHQELARRGERGYVDEEGRPTDGFPDAEARIARFAELGLALIGDRSSVGAVA